MFAFSLCRRLLQVPEEHEYIFDCEDNSVCSQYGLQVYFWQLCFQNSYVRQKYVALMADNLLEHGARTITDLASSSPYFEGLLWKYQPAAYCAARAIRYLLSIPFEECASMSADERLAIVDGCGAYWNADVKFEYLHRMARSCGQQSIWAALGLFGDRSNGWCADGVLELCLDSDSRLSISKAHDVARVVFDHVARRDDLSPHNVFPCGDKSPTGNAPCIDSLWFLTLSTT